MAVGCTRLGIWIFGPEWLSHLVQLLLLILSLLVNGIYLASIRKRHLCFHHESFYTKVGTRTWESQSQLVGYVFRHGHYQTQSSYQLCLTGHSNCSIPRFSVNILNADNLEMSPRNVWPSSAYKMVMEHGGFVVWLVSANRDTPWEQPARWMLVSDGLPWKT